jgi:hypothetical protein
LRLFAFGAHSLRPDSEGMEQEHKYEYETEHGNDYAGVDSLDHDAGSFEKFMASSTRNQRAAL